MSLDSDGRRLKLSLSLSLSLSVKWVSAAVDAAADAIDCGEMPFVELRKRERKWCGTELLLLSESEAGKKMKLD